MEMKQKYHFQKQMRLTVKCSIPYMNAITTSFAFFHGCKTVELEAKQICEAKTTPKIVQMEKTKRQAEE